MRFVRYVGSNSCRSGEYLAALAGTSGEIVLDPSSRRRNITVEFTLDGGPVHVSLAPLARDLLDIAACVYVADELASREATPDHWTRIFDYLVPVRDVATWAAASVQLHRT